MINMFIVSVVFQVLFVNVMSALMGDHSSWQRFARRVVVAVIVVIVARIKVVVAVVIRFLVVVTGLLLDDDGAAFIVMMVMLATGQKTQTGSQEDRPHKTLAHKCTFPARF